MNNIDTIFFGLTALAGFITFIFMWTRSLNDKIAEVRRDLVKLGNSCLQKDQLRDFIDPIRHDISEIRHRIDELIKSAK